MFYSAGGYEFFNVIDPKNYSNKWLNFVGNLYSKIDNNKYSSIGKKYSIPLTELQKQELLDRGVPEIFLVDL